MLKIQIIYQTIQKNKTNSFQNVKNTNNISNLMLGRNFNKVLHIISSAVALLAYDCAVSMEHPHHLT
jgi:hypothetical protein